MLCALILYVSGGIYSLTSTPNAIFLRNFFIAGILFTLRVFARNLLRDNRRRNIFGDCNNPTHYILDHVDFINDCLQEIIHISGHNTIINVALWLDMHY